MSNSMSLYDINRNYADLFDKFDDGEISTEELKEKGEFLAKELKEKSKGIIGFQKNVELTISAYKEEEERLKERRKSLENKLEKFKQYVMNNMKEMGIEKIETPLGILSISKNPVSVEITDEKMIPEEYLIIEQVKKPNKKAIKEALQSNIDVQGVRLVSDKTSLRIK